MENLKEELETIEFNKFRNKTKDEIDSLLQAIPIYRMKFRIIKREYFAGDGYDWLLPRLKLKILKWNEEAGNPEQDPNHENYAWYERLQ